MRPLAAIATLACVLAAPLPASSQPARRVQPRPAPVRTAPPLPASSDEPKALRAHFGVEKALHLLRSAEPDERLRGLERAAAIGTPEAVALLVQQVDASAATRTDPRAKIAVARGLAGHVSEAAARGALLAIVGLAAPRPSSLKSDADDPVYAPRLEVARRIAALALAQSGDPHAIESLVAVARGTSAGVAAAMAAIEAYPPSGTAIWAKPATVATVRLVGRTGDRRALEMVLDAAKGADPATKGAALVALGELGDARAIELATAALTDDDSRVRTAAATALVALGAPEGAKAVEQLVADDGTAGRGIELAMSVHGPGVVRALAARVAVAADLGVRSGAVAALGRDATAEGIEALSTLVADPMLRADAADAIARSPSGAAMGAIERLAAAAATRRLAARAYVVRARVRGETSGALERVVAELAAAADGKDRAMGVFAQVALGHAEATRWLGDRDPQVRRAAAMGSLAQETSATRAALLARRAREDDPATRVVLGAGLVDGDDAGTLPTRALLDCSHGGGADAPLCTLAVARRAPPEQSADVDALLASRDPMIRAHAARGLAGSADPTRGGRLASAYAYEPDPLVRRALVAALGAARTDAPDAPSVAEALALAAHLDPDPEIRATAARFASSLPPATAGDTDLAWIHLVEATGAPPPGGATGSVLRADGLAVPIAFDADGDALVPGLPAGTARLVLAPRLDAAYAPPQ